MYFRRGYLCHLRAEVGQSAVATAGGVAVVVEDAGVGIVNRFFTSIFAIAGSLSNRVYNRCVLIMDTSQSISASMLTSDTSPSR